MIVVSSFRTPAITLDPARRDDEDAERYAAGRHWFAGAAALLLLLLAILAFASSKASLVLLPIKLRSTRFSVTIDGQPAYFLNAAANYYDLNFDLKGRTKISITAPTEDYWARGVEVQPWRENIRPTRRGAMITFLLDHPAKLSISRPGDHLANAEMLFLFANEPERDAPTTSSNGVRYYGPGIHRENIDAHTGDRIYLAPGAIILGGLNLWDVEDGKVFGRGKILYNLRVPASGGYSFSVLSRDGSRLVIDDTEVAHSPET